MTLGIFKFIPVGNKAGEDVILGRLNEGGSILLDEVSTSALREWQYKDQTQEEVQGTKPGNLDCLATY